MVAKGLTGGPARGCEPAVVTVDEEAPPTSAESSMDVLSPQGSALGSALGSVMLGLEGIDPRVVVP